MSVISEQSFKSTLASNGLKCTRERLVLFRTIHNLQSPCSIAELIALTLNQMDSTTVYRNLELFEKINVTTRVYTGWKYKVELSDAFHQHHHHMTCTNCGETSPFKEPASFIQELKKIERQNGFNATSHTLELVGLCNKCC